MTIFQPQIDFYNKTIRIIKTINSLIGLFFIKIALKFLKRSNMTKKEVKDLFVEFPKQIFKG